MGLKDAFQLDVITKRFTWLTNENRIMVVILGIALVQGLSNIADFSYLYKDDYQLDPAAVSSLTGLITIPWLIKPLWGMISDNIPLFGYRRKSYLVLMASICAISYFLLGFWSTSIVSGLIFIFLTSFTFSFNSVLGEALIVESSQTYASEPDRTEEEKQARASKTVSMFFGARSLGSFATSYFSGELQETMNKRKIYEYTAFLPLAVAALGLTLPENKVGVSERLVEGDEKEELVVGRMTQAREQAINTFQKIKSFISQPMIYKPLGILFLFALTPSASTAMFYFYTNELHFDPEFIGELRFVSACASLMGIFLYNRFLNKMDFKTILYWSTIIGFVLGLTQIMLVTRANVGLGIPDKLFCLGDSLILQVIGEINMMPLLALACRLCPKNIEGTMYALLMSIFNFGGVVSMQLGALFTWMLGITENNFTNLWALVLISCVSCLLPLPFLNTIEIDSAVKLTEKEGLSDEKTDDEDIISLGTMGSRTTSDEIY